MSDVVISVDNISKKFCRTLKHTMLYGTLDLTRNFFGLDQNSGKLRDGEFWAVEDCAFKLKRGECLGLIGPNGSGKSTLLKMLNGIFMPDQGSIEVKGRVGALIEVGVGFHPMLTGRENIYINGSILGMSKMEIDEKFDDIVEFSGVGEFIEAPVKHYSSGMRVRLGFAVASHCEPDILIIDEVLAVGDFRFKQKCFERINNLRGNTTILFVSHSMRDITMLCDSSIVMNKGKVVFGGSSEQGVDHYFNLMGAEEDEITREKGDLLGIYGEIYHNRDKITDVFAQWVGQTGEPVNAVEYGTELTLEFSFKLLKPARNLIVGVPLWNGKGDMVTAIGTDMGNLKINVGEDGTVIGSLKIDHVVFNPDTYMSFIAVVDGKEFLFRNSIGTLRINGQPSTFGTFTPMHSWHFESKTDINNNLARRKI